ncbi:hypothetical protein XFF6166_80070 [Xanthomonas citri pv. fuscans]|nr:hypothetical protein XFF6166_80070 [Xanthomonas citri pv. fuscans]SOO03187.1 hypothetical protein XFF7767_150069 [Xanthomonas citri pv. fuscans]
MSKSMHLSDLATPQFRHDPYPTYARLREEGPLVQVADGRLMSGRYAMVDRLLGDRRVGRDYLQSIRLRYGETAVHLPLFQGMSRMFLLLNPPLHPVAWTDDAGLRCSADGVHA